jgi:hypothetical protein
MITETPNRPWIQGSLIPLDQCVSRVWVSAADENIKTEDIYIYIIYICLLYFFLATLT